MERLSNILTNRNWSSILYDPKIIGTAAAVVMAYYYLKQKSESDAISFTFESQSIELPGPEQIRVNAKCCTLIDINEVECKTVHEIFMKGVQLSGDRPFLGTRRDAESAYEWMTYNEVYQKSEYIGYALCEFGYKKGDMVGISAINRPEWVMIDQGAVMFSMVLVPLYVTLGIEGLNHILNQTELSILFSDLANLTSILDAVENTEHVKTIVTLEKVSDESIIARANKMGLKLLDFDELLEIGKRHYHKKDLPGPEDIALICYTSGTTGRPKGVMLTHKNIAANIEGFKNYEYAVHHSDIYVSYLPLSHVYERVGEYLIMSGGGSIGFFRGVIKELVSDIESLKPTAFPAVPRVLNLIYDKVMNEVSQSWFKRYLFKLAISAKEREISRGIIRRDGFWDKVVFHKIRKLLGDRVHVITSGAAPLSSKVKQFFKCAFGCMVFEGYGQTELTAMSNFTYALDPSMGHVGPPAPCCRIKLCDVPDMDYYSKDGKGEVCVQGPSVFKGYFKDPEKTSETIDEDGWCHTGDIGKWLPNGTLCIIDRKKHIFKLAQGEYVAPEKIENVYLTTPFVSQIFVTGNSLKTFIVAVVCPDHDVLQKWAKKKGITGTVEELCKNEIVSKAILEDLREVGAAQGLNSLEQVKAVYLSSVGFTIEDDLLTPTMKVKRNKVSEKFADEIEYLYSSVKK